MDNLSDSSNSIMALDENLVRVDSPDSDQPSEPARWSHFAGVPNATECVLSTLSKFQLRDLHHVYQIPELVNLRVPTFVEWASSCLLN